MWDNERFGDCYTQGFLITAALWGMVAATARSFYEVSSTAGLLLAPYQVWVTFATVAAFMGYRKNKNLKGKLN